MKFKISPVPYSIITPSSRLCIITNIATTTALVEKVKPEPKCSGQLCPSFSDLVESVYSINAKCSTFLLTQPVSSIWARSERLPLPSPGGKCFRRRRRLLFDSSSYCSLSITSAAVAAASDPIGIITKHVVGKTDSIVKFSTGGKTAHVPIPREPGTRLIVAGQSKAQETALPAWCWCR